MQTWIPIAISLLAGVVSALGAFWGVRVALARIEEQIRYHDWQIARLEEFRDRDLERGGNR